MRASVLAVLAGLSVVPRLAAADDVFVLRAPADAPIAIAPAVVALTPEMLRFLSPDEQAVCPNRCEPGRVPAFDRWTLGASSRAAAAASDVLLVSIPAAAFGLAALDHQGGARFWTDAALIVQAMSLGALAVEMTKLAVGRLRPWVYDESTVPTDPDARLSFFSGHTTFAFAAATSFAEIYRRRHPDDAAVPLVWGVSATLAATVGLLRVLAGKHFPSDVLVGALVGTALGILVPAAHAS